MLLLFYQLHLFNSTLWLRLALIIATAVSKSSLFISAFYLRNSFAAIAALPYMHTHHNEGKIQHWQSIAIEVQVLLRNVYRTPNTKKSVENKKWWQRVQRIAVGNGKSYVQFTIRFHQCGCKSGKKEKSMPARRLYRRLLQNSQVEIAG